MDMHLSSVLDEKSERRAMQAVSPMESCTTWPGCDASHIEQGADALSSYDELQTFHLIVPLSGTMSCVLGEQCLSGELNKPLVP